MTQELVKVAEVRTSELNRAIYKVLTTQFKKDAREEHKMVEAAGYTISKLNGGCFAVYNPETKRHLSINWSRDWYRATLMYGNGWRGKKLSLNKDDLKFDFVGCLNKPVNVTWAELQRYEEDRPTIRKYEGLKSERWYVKYHKEEIEKVQKEMEKLQRDLIYHAGQLTKAEADLKAKKKELGL